MAETEVINILAEAAVGSGVGYAVSKGIHDANIEKAKIEELVEMSEDLLSAAAKVSGCEEERQDLRNEIDRANREINKKDTIIWSSGWGAIGSGASIIAISVAFPVAIIFELIAGAGLGGGIGGLLKWLRGKLSSRHKKLEKSYNALKECIEAKLKGQAKS